jgi:hypothetical protein
LAASVKVKKIVVQSGETSLSFENIKAFENQKLITAIDCFGSRVKITMSNLAKLEFANNIDTNSQMLGVLREFLDLTRK